MCHDCIAEIVPGSTHKNNIQLMVLNIVPIYFITEYTLLHDSCTNTLDKSGPIDLKLFGANVRISADFITNDS